MLFFAAALFGFCLQDTNPQNRSGRVDVWPVVARFFSVRNNLDQEGVYLLTRVRKVQEDLRLTPRDLEIISKANHFYISGMNSLFRDQVTSSDPPEKLAELNAKKLEITKEEQNRLLKGLGSNKVDRLTEIAIQVSGVASITWPVIQQKLQLSGDQITSAALLKREYRKSLKLLEADYYKTVSAKPEFDKKGNNQPGHQVQQQSLVQRIAEFEKTKLQLRSKYTKQLNDLITSGQQKTLKAMKGKPIDYLDELVIPGG